MALDFLNGRLGTLAPQLGGDSFLDYLRPILRRHKAVMSGGMILQSLIGETWESSDVDIYVSEDSLGYLIQDLQQLRSIWAIIPSPNYHNSFMRKNSIAFLAEGRAILMGPRHYVRLFDGNVTEHEYRVEHIPEDLPRGLTILDMDDVRFGRRPGRTSGTRINIQIMGVKSDIPLENVIGTFDLTFCQVLFDGDTFKTCGETTMADVLAKRGRLAIDYYQMYNFTLHKRITKYLARGFTIDVDWSKIAFNVNPKNRKQYLLGIISNSFQSRLYFTSSMIPYNIKRFFTLHMLSCLNEENFVEKMMECPETTEVMDYFIKTWLPETIIDLIAGSKSIDEILDKQQFNYQLGKSLHLQALQRWQTARDPAEPIDTYLIEDVMYPKYRFLTEHVSDDFGTPVVRQLREQGKLRPGKDCWLIGASALAFKRGIKVKPTYLIHVPKIPPWSRNISEFAKGFGARVLSSIKSCYREFDDCYIVAVTVPLIFAAALWPVPTYYYDGTTWNSVGLHSSSTFYLRFMWARMLRKSHLLAKEYNDMINMGFTYQITSSKAGYDGSYLSNFVWSKCSSETDVDYYDRTLKSDRPLRELFPESVVELTDKRYNIDQTFLDNFTNEMLSK
jgi:hypothetical protein